MGYKRTTLLPAALSLLIIALVGCGGIKQEPGGTRSLQSITVAPSSTAVNVGSTQQFTASGKYSDGSTQDLTQTVSWSSSNTAFATIDAKGMLTAVAPGSVTLTASSGGVSGTASATINPTATPALQSITVAPPSAVVNVGSTQQFTASGKYSDGSTQDITQSVTWSSSNTAFATIDGKGLLTAVAPGSVTVTATSGAISGTASATINPTGTRSLQSITVTPPSTALNVGASQQFTASGKYSDGSTQDITQSVTWSSSNTAFATIDAKGLLTGVAPGSVTVTASSGGISGTASATINQVQTSSGVNVLTWHNDVARTGANTQETILTPANVNSSTFGKLFQLTVDGDVQAQPLYASNLLVNGQAHNVVFVATQNDVVYAFDADNGNALWKRSFIVNGATVPTAPVCCPNHPGITGTPVIDLASNTMYLVVRTNESGKDVQRLYALDISTGQIRNSVVINPSIAGNGDANQTTAFCGVQSTTVIFCNPTQNQRVGLLLARGLIWVMYAAHSDKHPYHGWVLAYDSSLKPVVVWNATPNGQGGGIWMSGAAPAADANDNIYFATGNGPFAPDKGNYGQAWIKMDPAGNVLSFFSPYNWDVLNGPDLDLGSGGGTLILPDQAGPDPHLLVGVDKNGTIYLLDRDNMGGHHDGDNSNVVQTICDAFPGRTDCATIRDGQDNHLIRSSPAYWNGFVYFAGQNDVIKAFQLTNGRLSTQPVSKGSINMGFPGSTVSISANGNSNGIAWLIDNKSSGVLRAYDATDVSKELYNSASSRDTTGSPFTRFVVPTIANGKVYVPTVNHVTVYGLLSSAPNASTKSSTLSAGSVVTTSGKRASTNSAPTARSERTLKQK